MIDSFVKKSIKLSNDIYFVTTFLTLVVVLQLLLDRKVSISKINLILVWLSSQENNFPNIINTRNS